MRKVYIDKKENLLHQLLRQKTERNRVMKKSQSNSIYSKIYAYISGVIQHYNHKKYWKMREEVTNPDSKKSLIIRLWYFYRIKRSEAFQNASMGTRLGRGSQFAEPPNLPHQLNGIIISPYAKIGKNCTIYQQVTIAQVGENKSATIGDNVLIGAGAKIIGAVNIGNNVKIGANAVIVKDIPSDSTAVGVPARIISHTKNE